MASRICIMKIWLTPSTSGGMKLLDFVVFSKQDTFNYVYYYAGYLDWLGENNKIQFALKG